MRTFFESHMDSPPSYPHLPPVANKLLWLRGFKIHIQVNIQLKYCSCSNRIGITDHLITAFEQHSQFPLNIQTVQYISIFLITSQQSIQRVENECLSLTAVQPLAFNWNVCEMETSKAN